ncbi:MAG: hypothetical protein ACFE0S_17510 [Rhodospirillales bacterium]
MPVAFHEKPDYAHFEVMGLATPQELVAAMAVQYEAHRPKLVLWDFSGASLSGMSPDSFGSLMETSKKFTAVRGAGAKTAVLVNAEIEKILVGAYAAFAKEVVGVEYATFFALADAEAWLRGA